MKLSAVREKNLYRKAKNLINRYHKKGLGFIRANSKTLISLDYSNECPKEKTGKPCPYCYKADLYRIYGKTGFIRGRVYQEGEVDEKTLRYFCREFKRLLKQYDRENFSIRLFSLGDYVPERRGFWRKVLAIMTNEGLRLHAITKAYRDIHEISDLLHTVNLSIDSIVPENSIETAEKYRKGIEETGCRVKIRSIVLNNADHKIGHKSDIVTVYHGSKRPGLTTYRTTNKTYTDLCNKLDEEVFHGKVCCTQNHKCTNCMRCH